MALNDDLATLAQTSNKPNKYVKKNCQKGQNPRNVCDNCQENIQEGQLKRHLKSCNIYFKFMVKLPTGYSCKLCSRKAKVRIQMNQHLKNIHGDKVFSDQKNTLENVKNGKQSKYGRTEGLVKENDKDQNVKMCLKVRKNCQFCKKSINSRKIYKHSEICKLLQNFSDEYKCSIFNLKLTNL